MRNKECKYINKCDESKNTFGPPCTQDIYCGLRSNFELRKNDNL